MQCEILFFNARAPNNNPLYKQFMLESCRCWTIANENITMTNTSTNWQKEICEICATTKKYVKCFSSHKQRIASSKKCENVEIEPNRAHFRIPIVPKQHALLLRYNNRTLPCHYYASTQKKQQAFTHYTDYKSWHLHAIKSVCTWQAHMSLYWVSSLGYMH